MRQFWVNNIDKIIIGGYDKFLINVLQFGELKDENILQLINYVKEHANDTNVLRTNKVRNYFPFNL